MLCDEAAWEGYSTLRNGHKCRLEAATLRRSNGGKCLGGWEVLSGRNSGDLHGRCRAKTQARRGLLENLGPFGYATTVRG